MTNRTRKIVLRVPVTPEEQELIRQKMALLHTRNFSAYARKMLIDGSMEKMSDAAKNVLNSAGVDITAIIKGAGEALIASMKEKK